ncbi:hypothetical protein HWV62_40547 [Athelia sp. TMB]|nr:hypothetical protein HWV62_40547 [Athelia sp. TMB]
MADVPPPPPYEVNQHEYDQKTQLAVEASLASNDGRDRASGSGDADEWEYDEAAFEAAFQAAVRINQHGGGTSYTDTAHKPEGYEKAHQPPPLDADRKSPAPSTTKERPSWYEEANVGGTSQSSSSSNRPLSASATRQSIPSQYPPPPDDEAPPPFQAEQPAYHGNGSAPPSPLSSPPLANAPLQPLRAADNRGRPSSWSTQPHPHSFSPPPQRQAQRTGSRLLNASTSPAPQRLNFDPSIAYSNGSRNSASPRLEAGNANPAAFYNRPTQFQTPQPISQSNNMNFRQSLTAAPITAPSFAPYNAYNSYQPPGMAPPAIPTMYNPAPGPYPAQGYAPSAYMPQSYSPSAFSGQANRWATSEDQLGFSL